MTVNGHMSGFLRSRRAVVAGAGSDSPRWRSP